MGGAPKAMGMLRMLAVEEQKKVAALRLAGASSKEIGAAEARLRHLTERLQEAPPAARSFSVERSSTSKARNEVFLDLSEEELRGVAERRGEPREVVTTVCASCEKSTARNVKTGKCTTYFCSSLCQRKGWPAHLERAQRREKEERAWRETKEEAAEEDAQWDRETARRLEEDGLDVDFLGLVRGKCLSTNCSGYVQRRGAPRNIEPKVDAAREKIEEVGVWAWNRIDHLACRRCGAPAEEHEDLTTHMTTKYKQTTAQKKPPKTNAPPQQQQHQQFAPLTKLEKASEYYYATAGIKTTTSCEPQRITKKNTSPADLLDVVAGEEKKYDGDARTTS